MIRGCRFQIARNSASLPCAILRSWYASENTFMRSSSKKWRNCQAFTGKYETAYRYPFVTSAAWPVPRLRRSKGWETRGGVRFVKHGRYSHHTSATASQNAPAHSTALRMVWVVMLRFLTDARTHLAKPRKGPARMYAHRSDAPWLHLATVCHCGIG